MIGGEEIQYTEGTVQGSSTAIAIYAITVIPLILMIVDITRQDNSSTKTVAYADNFTAARKITQPKKWWDTLCQLGSKFGYYPEVGKSRLIIKRNQYYAADIFRRKSIKITTVGLPRLRTVIGSLDASNILNTSHTSK